MKGTWGKKCFDDLDQRRMGRPATKHVEYGLPPPRRIQAEKRLENG